MTDNGSQETGPVFVRGNEHLDRLLSDPQIAAESPRPTQRPRRWTGFMR